MTKQEYKRLERKIRLLEFMRNKPYRDLRKSIDNLKIAFLSVFGDDIKRVNNYLLYLVDKIIK